MQKKTDRDLRKRYSYKTYKGTFWEPGEPLTPRDERMLDVVRAFYRKKGYTPKKSEVSNSDELKIRFRTWKNVLTAAGLPPMTNADNVKKRQEALAWKNRVNALLK